MLLDIARRWTTTWALALCLVLCVRPAEAQEEQVHTVERGQSLGGIAKRYGLSVKALCDANDLSRRDPIRPGQKLVIPSSTERTTPATSTTTSSSAGIQTLEVRNTRVYYFEPQGRGRLAPRPIVMYMHGRGANPQNECMRWAPVARPFGWLVCPSGPVEEGAGRAWGNDWNTGNAIAEEAIRALRSKYKARVKLQGNTLIGFSEGAFVAMNIGVRSKGRFSRLLVLAANDSYWGAGAPDLLAKARGLRRVYLITGREDAVIEATAKTEQLLRRAKVPTRLVRPPFGHLVALESQPNLYREALSWLTKGS